jgi:hypothetical protein
MLLLQVFFQKTGTAPESTHYVPSSEIAQSEYSLTCAYADADAVASNGRGGYR